MTGSDDEARFAPAPVRSRDFAPARGSRADADADADADIAACKQILAVGSKSFAAASLLLPGRMRGPAAAFYAFCRIADDLVDFSDEPNEAVTQLTARLDRIYAGTPDDDPVDRAFARVVRDFALPRALIDALIEGFEWDARERDYETLAELLAYCARVASAVGVVMTLLMGPREPRTLARACDLGAAMQLTNICRDVLEDAERGRLYLPAAWLRERGVDPVDFVARPGHYAGDARVAEVVEAVLREADEYYLRADAGIGMLPRDARPAIRAASLIYADIGRVIREQGCDPSRGRAHTSKARKLWLLIRAWVWPTPSGEAKHADAPVIDECAFLIEPVVDALPARSGDHV
ncbi:All-trans-phytoene synthase/15-cis-phytoene synthase [Enhygromyxa salina]|uniref:All-trans-phytoene synthase/15-cis-phytoene synthase n=1 Tax=Enhygromyxa salina TaxID=215803 RepID=A0A2S9YCI6_9BACT|nr:phytoene/squalene synthase family protein [Enhygromyxa salina]PRQ02762.1 All-trans-phytoene synthase/15-cis-phytoene synthase [Enhygromyxa salina]